MYIQSVYECRMHDTNILKQQYRSSSDNTFDFLGVGHLVSACVRVCACACVCVCVCVCVVAREDGVEECDFFVRTKQSTLEITL